MTKRSCSFRHFGGSWLAHITEGNVLVVKKALRHKQVENTMKYIHRIDFQDPQRFDVATATTVDEIKSIEKQVFKNLMSSMEHTFSGAQRDFLTKKM